MGETLFLYPGQQLVQNWSFQRNPEDCAVTQTALTQWGRRRFHRGSPFLLRVPGTPPWSGPKQETAAGFQRVAPAPRSGAIPRPTGDELARPESVPPRTRRKRGNEWRVPVRTPG